MTAVVYARTPVRPHLVNASGLCWCKPVWDDLDGEGFWLHRYCELLPDVQPRMAVYSL